MARNAEKAMTALARWRRMKEQEEKGPIAKRPNDVRDCKKVGDAERFRREIVMEISKKIASIQNPGLGEFKIRDLNDEINKMLRLKFAWEGQIKKLGGPDYRRIAPRELDQEGREVAGSRGYKYFGAAKDLPGVRELFQKAAEEEPGRKTRGELMRSVDADYYGYMDDDDGLLVPLEKAEEEKAIRKIDEVCVLLQSSRSSSWLSTKKLLGNEMTSTYLGVGAGTGQKSTYFSLGPTGGGGSNAFGGGEGPKPAAAGVSVYLGMPSGGAGAATSDYFDNTKTAVGGIPMDNTKTAVGGIPMDNTKTAIGGIPFDNTQSVYLDLEWRDLRFPSGFGGAAPAAASSAPAAANQSVYLGLGGGSLGATQPGGDGTGGGGKPAPGVSVYFAAPCRGAGGAPGVTSCYFASK